MSGGDSLERFGEKDLVFIKWRSCRHCFKNEWTLVDIILLALTGLEESVIYTGISNVAINVLLDFWENLILLEDFQSFVTVLFILSAGD